MKKRVLHVHANISKCASLVHVYNISSVNSTVPESNPSGITPSKTSKRSKTVLRPGTIIAIVTKDPYFTTNSTTVTVSIVENKPVTENNEPNYVIFSSESSMQLIPIAVGSSPAQIIIIGGVLGAVVIIGILISIATVMVIIYKKGQKVSFDLTTNEAYTERQIHKVHHIDEGDDSYEAIQHGTSDVSDVPLEQNATYIVTSSIVASRNVACESAS